MRLTTISLAALVVPAFATQDNFFARQAKFREDSRIAKEKHFGSAAVDDDVTSKAPKFLTAKTKKYKVDGTALPFVDFDIGESYSGLMPIDSTGRELFFWFFPTQGDGKKDITIWLNGGPGCSSLEGFFEENGPVVWQPGTYGPRKNPYALNKLSNVVYVEQPVGTGFTQGKPNATNEVEVGKQFDGFWKNFLDTFDIHNYGIYITGESYAGQYVPYIGDAFLKAGGKKYHDLKGILIYDPVIGPFENIEPAAVPFMQYNAASFAFDEEFTTQLANLQESCGYAKYMEEGLTFPPKKHLHPPSITKKCDTYDLIINKAFTQNPCFNIYHVSEICPTLDDILGGPTGPAGPRIKSLTTPYFQRSDVKKVIHAPEGTQWNECSRGVLTHDHSPGSATRNGPVERIAEATHNVIVGHATQDYILLSNQTLLTLNNLVWNGKQGFEAGPNTPLMIPQNKKSKSYTQIGKWTKSRGLTFVEVNLSGHMIPQFNPRADFRIQEVLHGRVKSLDAKVPFTV